MPAALLLSLHTLPSLAAGGTPLGWGERGMVLPEEVTVKFKLDTGALTSSMHAEDIEYFERDGDEWVRFDLDLKDIERDKLVKSRIERKLHRELTVRGAGGKEEDRKSTRLNSSH